MCKDEFKEVEETVYEKVCRPGYTKAETPYSQRVKRQAVESYSAPIDSYGAPSAPLLPPTPQPCQTNDPRFTSNPCVSFIQCPFPGLSVLSANQTTHDQSAAVSPTGLVRANRTTRGQPVLALRETCGLTAHHRDLVRLAT